MSGSINTSMYPQAKPSNPLEMIGQYTNAMQALNQNKLFQEQDASRQAMQQIYQSAMDPQTGQVDQAHVITGLVNNPATAKFAPQLIQQALQSRQLDVETAMKQFDLAKTKVDRFAQIAGAGIQAGPTVDYNKDIVPLGIAAGFSPQEMAAYGMTLGREGLSGPGLLAKLKQIQQSALTTEQQYARAHQLFTMNTGNNTVVGSVNTMGEAPQFTTGQTTNQMGALPAGSPTVVPSGVSPETSSQLVEVVDNTTGQKKLVPRASVGPMATGIGNPGQGAPMPGQNMAGLDPVSDEFIKKTYPDLRDEATNMATILPKLEGLRELEKTMNGGKGQPTLTEIAGILQRFNINDPGLIKSLTGPGGYNAYQQFYGQIMQSVMAEKALQKSQYINASELSHKLESIAGGANVTPAARLALTNNTIAQASVPIALQKAAAQFMQAQQDPTVHQGEFYGVPLRTFANQMPTLADRIIRRKMKELEQ